MKTFVKVMKALSDPDEHLELHSKESAIPFRSTLNPSRQTEILSLKGPRAIETFTIKVNAKDMDKALRRRFFVVQLFTVARIPLVLVFFVIAVCLLVLSWAAIDLVDRTTIVPSPVIVG